MYWFEVTRHTKAHDNLSSKNANINRYVMLRRGSSDVLLSYHSALLEWYFFYFDPHMETFPAKAG